MSAVSSASTSESVGPKPVTMWHPPGLDQVLRNGNGHAAGAAPVWTGLTVVVPMASAAIPLGPFRR